MAAKKTPMGKKLAEALKGRDSWRTIEARRRAIGHANNRLVRELQRNGIDTVAAKKAAIDIIGKKLVTVNRTIKSGKEVPGDRELSSHLAIVINAQLRHLAQMKKRRVTGVDRDKLVSNLIHEADRAATQADYIRQLRIHSVRDRKAARRQKRQ